MCNIERLTFQSLAPKSGTHIKAPTFSGTLSSQTRNEAVRGHYFDTLNMPENIAVARKLLSPTCTPFGVHGVHT